MKPSRLSKWPFWKTHVAMPSDAPRDSTLMISALTGSTTDPVMRNMRTNVAMTTAAIA